MSALRTSTPGVCRCVGESVGLVLSEDGLAAPGVEVIEGHETIGPATAVTGYQIRTE